MNRLCIYLVSILAMDAIAAADTSEGSSLNVIMGGCSIRIVGAIDLVSRSDLDASFVSRLDQSSTFRYSAHDPAIYADGAPIVIASRSSRANLKALKMVINNPDNLGNMNGTQYAYIHDSEDALAVFGPMASMYWSIFDSSEHLVDCSEWEEDSTISGH